LAVSILLPHGSVIDPTLYFFSRLIGTEDRGAGGVTEITGGGDVGIDGPPEQVVVVGFAFLPVRAAIPGLTVGECQRAVVKEIQESGSCVFVNRRLRECFLGIDEAFRVPFVMFFNMFFNVLKISFTGGPKIEVTVCPALKNDELSVVELIELKDVCNG